VNGKDHGQCLTEETLTEYLEGGLDPAIKAASEAHLVTCDECRTKLGYFMRILEPEMTGKEVSLLQAVTAEWDKKKRKYKTQRRTGMFPTFLMAVAVVSVLIIGVVATRFLMERPAEPKSAGEVVQLLLAQSRPFESRLSREPRLPILRTRGTDDPGASYGLLAAEMTRLSANSHEMGRFYLLQKDFNRAIPYLEIAEGEVGANSEVHNDLGVGYLESGNSELKDKARLEFQHALESNPSFAPAIFNLALFYETVGETTQAAAEWNLYLQMDSKSDWAMEARERLQGLSR